jgi:GGDEF domain-containing protein
VLPNSGYEHARQAAARLCEGLQSEVFSIEDPGISLKVTASFGFASAGEPNATSTDRDLLSLADSRLYSAKAAGRACVKP